MMLMLSSMGNGDADSRVTMEYCAGLSGDWRRGVGRCFKLRQLCQDPWPEGSLRDGFGGSTRIREGEKGDVRNDGRARSAE